MTSYAVYSTYNPCGGIARYWSKSWDIWAPGKPQIGIDINKAYALLEYFNNKHFRNKGCECRFEVVEIE